jgi:hypothetical protein
MKTLIFRLFAWAGVGFACIAGLSSTAEAARTFGIDPIGFDLTRPKVLDRDGPGCLPDARGYVWVKSYGFAEKMKVKVEGLPPKTNFDVFVIQVPNAPFGLSWYQGDIETNRFGYGHATFIGRFNEETFIVAPGADGVVAPATHTDKPFPDARKNPITGPIHTYHVGIWFNSPEDALLAGCPGATTPFNGEHKAGIQILNTGSFEDEAGPLLPLA